MKDLGQSLVHWALAMALVAMLGSSVALAIVALIWLLVRPTWQ